MICLFSLYLSQNFVFNWIWNFPSGSPNSDCTIDDSCDLSTASFSVTSVAVGPVPYSLILDGNAAVSAELPPGYGPPNVPPLFAMQVSG